VERLVDHQRQPEPDQDFERGRYDHENERELDCPARDIIPGKTGVVAEADKCAWSKRCVAIQTVDERLHDGRQDKDGHEH